MAFDFEELMNNPMFTMGAGLLGGASQRTQPLLTAYKLMQQQKQMQQEAENNKYLNLSRMAQAAAATQNAARYGEDVELRKKAAERDEDARRTLEPAIGRFMEQLGIPAPAQPRVGPPSPFAPDPQPQSPQPQLPSPPAQSMQAPQQPMPQAAPPSLFPQFDKFVLRIEGAPVPNDAGKGPTVEGVNQSSLKGTPFEGMNVHDMTPEQRTAFRQTYWQSINGDSLPPSTAAIGYDAAINQGQSYAQNLLKITGGDPKLMLYQRERDYEKLAASSPMHKQYLAGWKQRLNNLREFIKDQPNELPAPSAPPEPTAQVSLSGAPNIEPHQQARGVAGIAAYMKGDYTGAFQNFAEAIKPDYSKQELGIKQQDLQLKQQKFGLDQKDIQLKGEAGARDAERVGMERARETRLAAEQTAKLREAKAKDWKHTGIMSTNLDNLSSKVSELISHPGLPGIYAAPGSIPDWPGSPAAQARTLHEGIVNNIAKEALQAIRDASPTGGALGNVSDADIKLLQTALQNLGSAQDVKSATKAMNEVLLYTKRIRNVNLAYYEKIHGESPLEGMPVGTRYAGTSKGRPAFKLPNGKIVVPQE